MPWCIISIITNNDHLHWCFSYFSFESLSVSFKDSKAEQTTSKAFFPLLRVFIHTLTAAKSLHFFDQLFKYWSACAGVLAEPCWLPAWRNPMPTAVHMGSLHNAARSSVCKKQNWQHHFSLGDKAERSPMTVCSSHVCWWDFSFWIYLLSPQMGRWGEVSYSEHKAENMARVLIFKIHIGILLSVMHKCGIANGKFHKGWSERDFSSKIWGSLLAGHLFKFSPATSRPSAVYWFCASHNMRI